MPLENTTKLQGNLEKKDNQYKRALKSARKAHEDFSRVYDLKGVTGQAIKDRAEGRFQSKSQVAMEYARRANTWFDKMETKFKDTAVDSAKLNAKDQKLVDVYRSGIYQDIRDRYLKDVMW